jgi:CDP-diacylglycerol--serine O-phosphatidyltransferase
MLSPQEGRLRFFRRKNDRPRRRFRRGVYLLPSLLTMGNMFCGYACVVYAMRGEFETAAPFIGFAVVIDGLDGRIARMTGTTSAFGVEFDSLADIISFGIAPAILSFAWGLQSLGRLGWAAGFMFVACAAMRLARFNIQSASGGDKRYFVGMPSPAAAAIPAATVYAYPGGLYDYRAALPALAMVIVPAILMVSRVPELQDARFTRAEAVHRVDLRGGGHHAHRHASALHAGRNRVRLPGIGVRRPGRHPLQTPR